MRDWKEYLFIILIGLIAGILYSIRTISEVDIKTNSQKIIYIVYGVLSSMFITWIGFEAFMYFGLGSSLSSALGGGLGFIGADRVAKLLVSFIKKKSDIE